jgi:hypothetical protein
VLRGPPAGSSLYPTDANIGDLLPDGFLERTKGKGLVWQSWDPEAESLWHGVPMAPWPLYAEQPLNAFELVPRGVHGRRR